MKHFKHVFLFVLLGCFMVGMAETIPLTKNPPDLIPLPGKGKRLPSKPMICNIDFEAGTIFGNFPLIDMVIEFQLWDEGGENCLCSSTDADFMNKVKDKPSGIYTMILVCDGYELIGYLSL